MTRPPALRSWILLGILVLILAGVMVRLGFWQIDRLHQRREFNARVSANQALPEAALDSALLSQDLVSMEYRRISLAGVYLLDQQVLLRNQVLDGQIGVHLLTPLRIDGSNQVVLVDRGWVPLEDASLQAVRTFDQPGMVSLHGIIRLGQSKVHARTSPASADSPASTSGVDLPALAGLTGQDLVPVYVQKAPEGSASTLPAAVLTEPELTEGSHASYAIQWFSFALILVVGYPAYVYSRLRRISRSARTLAVAPHDGHHV